MEYNTFFFIQEKCEQQCLTYMNTHTNVFLNVNEF